MVLWNKKSKQKRKETLEKKINKKAEHVSLLDKGRIITLILQELCIKKYPEEQKHLNKELSAQEKKHLTKLKNKEKELIQLLKEYIKITKYKLPKRKDEEIQPFYPESFFNLENKIQQQTEKENKHKLK
jgi:hypothetical protein